MLLSDVLKSSPAAVAGVQAGDVLVRYGDQPIYDVRDLMAETTSGKLGQSESIDVERDGERLRFYVERGPLGAKIQPMRRPPAAQPRSEARPKYDEHSGPEPEPEPPPGEETR